MTSCTYVVSGYYGGYCDCGNTYSCNKETHTCERTQSGDLSKADCEAAC